MAFVILVCFIPFNGCHCNPAFQICPLLQHCSHPRSAWTLPPLTDPSWWESRPYRNGPATDPGVQEGPHELRLARLLPLLQRRFRHTSAQGCRWHRPSCSDRRRAHQKASKSWKWFWKRMWAQKVIVLLQIGIPLAAFWCGRWAMMLAYALRVY